MMLARVAIPGRRKSDGRPRCYWPSMTYHERLTIENPSRSRFVESLKYDPRLELESEVLEVRRTQCGHPLGRVHHLGDQYVWVAATRRTNFDRELVTQKEHGDRYAALLVPTEDARGVTLYAECRHGLWPIPGPWLAERLQSSLGSSSRVAMLDTDKLQPAPDPLRFDD